MPKAVQTLAMLRCAVESLEIRRHLSFGSLVPSFGGTGVVDIPVANGVSVNASAEAVQSDGKIVLVGTTSDHRVAVARFNTNGTLDTTFGTGGETLFHFSSGQDVGKAVAIQPNGEIIVAGAENDNDGGAIDHSIDPTSSTDAAVAVARLTTAGKLDTTFGDSGGIFSIHFTDAIDENQRAVATNVLVLPSGEIIVTGSIYDINLIGPTSADFLALRLYSTGKLDHTYDDDGVQQLDLGGLDHPDTSDPNQDDYSYDSALDLNGTASTNPNYGKVIIVGENDTTSGKTQKIGVDRLDTNGKVDSTFNKGKPYILPFINGYYQSIARGVVVAANDDIIIAGQAWAGTPGTNTDFGLIALKNTGAIDTSFGTNGVTLTDFGGANDSAASIAISQSGDYIVGGSSNGTLAIAAYTPSGKLDTTFGTNGKITSSEPAIRDLVLGAGGTFITTSSTNSTTEALYDAVPIASIGSLNSSTTEGSSATASFLVTESTRVNYARNVYINISGSATLSTFTTIKFKTADYSLSGIVIPTLLSGPTTPYVVIPANQTFALVTLTPIDDTRVEGDETAIFSIAANPSYNIDPANPSTTLTIHDNDGDATQRFNAAADAYVRDGSSYATTNFGSASQLQVKNASTGNNRQSYVEFNLSSLSSVNSVKLQLYGELVVTPNSSSTITADVFGVSSSWNESTIDYNNKPAASTGSLGSIAVSGTALQLYTLDITSYVKAQLAAGHKTITLLLKSLTTSPGPYIAFNSREATADGPQLIVS